MGFIIAQFKGITQASILAVVAAAGGLFVSYGLITNATEQHYLGLLSILGPIAFLIGRSVLSLKTITGPSLLALIIAVVGGIVQAGFIDSDKGKQIIGLATVLTPVAVILVHAAVGFFHPAVASRGPYGPQLIED